MALQRAQRRVALGLGPVGHLAATPQTGGVDEAQLPSLPGERRVDGVPRRARDVADDDTLLAEELVEEGRLAHVGAAHDGHARGRRGVRPDDGRQPGVRLRRPLHIELLEARRLVGLRLVLAEQPEGEALLHPGGQVLGLDLALLALAFFQRLPGQGGHDGVEEVAGAPPVERADGIGLVEPAQAQELGALQLQLLVVGLVDGHDHRRGRPPQGLSDLLVCRRQAGGGVHDEDDDVRLLDGQASLVLDRSSMVSPGSIAPGHPCR